MLGWLVDNAVTVYFLLGIAALGLFALWWMNRQGKYLIALVCMVGLIGLVWLAAQIIVTDNKLLEQICQEMAQGIRGRNVEPIFKHISKSFNRANHAAMDRAQLRELANNYLRRQAGEDVQFSKFSFANVSREKGAAQVEFWVFGAGELQGMPIRCESDFVLEDDSWRMKGFKLFIGNTGNQYPFP